MVASVKLQKTLVYFFVSVLLLGVFFPALIRNVFIFLLLASIAGYLSFIKSKLFYDSEFFRAGVGFFTLAFVYLVFSLLFPGWQEGYFVNRDFIARQSYFVVFMPMFMIVGYVLFNTYNFKKGRFYLILLLLILFLDYLLAYFFGNQEFFDNNGYTFYLEKSVVWFFVCICYFYNIFLKKYIHMTFLIALLFFLLQTIEGYGTMFNATTGQVLFLFMLTAYIGKLVMKTNLYIFLVYLFVFLSLLLFVFLAPFYADGFVDDENTYWRLISWQDNIVYVLDSYMFGAGFGVSYFPDNYESVNFTYKKYLSEGYRGGLYDPLFIRGQHSSIINVFFRLGLVGVLLFLYFICKSIAKLIRTSNNPLIAVSGATFFCGLVNVSVHVGLESPPFLLTFSLAFGLLIASLNAENRSCLSSF